MAPGFNSGNEVRCRQFFLLELPWFLLCFTRFCLITKCGYLVFIANPLVARLLYFCSSSLSTAPGEEKHPGVRRPVIIRV